MPNNVAALQQVQDNLVRLLLVVTQAIAAGTTQSGIDAINAAYATAAAAGTAAGVVVPKPNYGVDSENYDWSEYRQGLEKSVETVQHLIIMLGGTFIARSRGMV